MSQFMLCRLKGNPTLSADCQAEKIADGFLLRASNAIFGSGESYCVKFRGKSIDQLFTDAQKMVNSKHGFEQTELSIFMRAIECSLIEAAFWYGSEFSDLDNVENFTELLAKLGEAVNETSCEAYLHYRQA